MANEENLAKLNKCLCLLVLFQLWVIGIYLPYHQSCKMESKASQHSDIVLFTLLLGVKVSWLKNMWLMVT